jgi:methyl-accepting chemotaxis protein
MTTTVGKTGYVYVLAGSGEQRGQYIISRNGERDGENIWEAKDSDGDYFIQAIIQKALTLKNGKIGYERYPWKNQGEATARMKIAAISYFEPWDWVIGVGVYEDDYYEARNKVGNALSSILKGSFFSASILLMLGAIGAFWVGSKIAQPMTNLAAIADKLALGDIHQNIDYRSHDETGKLAESFRNMVQSLRDKADVAAHIAKGHLGVDAKAVSGSDVLGKAMVTMKESIGAMISDVEMLATSAMDGRLNIRADAAKHEGDFGKIVRGINSTLGAVINPVDEAATVLEKVAVRDLSVRMQGEYRGDHARIKQALNKAIDNLDQGLQQVAVGTEQVATAATQISTGSQNMAQGANEQASSLEEVSSSLQEMSSMTRQNAVTAKEAKNLADNTRASAANGVESMNRLSEAINRIKASSDDTAKIVKTIDEIAFQTNLLALNAAVEAARAGDAGKGFAVVAEEVRNLTMRSADAAKNTASMIEEAVKNAGNGVALNEGVLKNLWEINNQVNKVGEMMAEISAASDQQNQGIEQINTAIEQMNQVTQQNAANSEESASAAEELSSQAEEMRSLVRNFKLSQEQTVSSEQSRIWKEPVRQAAPAKGHLAVKSLVRPKLGKLTNIKPKIEKTPASAIPFDDDNGHGIFSEVNDDPVLKEF